MTTVYDVPADKIVSKLSDELKDIYDKKKMNPPEWVSFVKTGNNKQRPPEDPDWWFVRCASMLRKIYIDGPVGVSRLRSYYGGTKNRGVRPSKFTKASGNILRKAMIQLEELGFVNTEGKKGRIISNQGRSLLDKVAQAVKVEIKDELPKLAVY